MLMNPFPKIDPKILELAEQIQDQMDGCRLKKP